MTIHWAKPLLQAVLPEDLWEQLHDEVQVDPSFDAQAASAYVIPFYNAKTGEHLKDAPTPNAIHASRRKMRAFCRKGIEVKWGKELQSIDFSRDEVTAIFQDGKRIEGSVLIGADGHRSRVRELLVGKVEATLKLVGDGYQLSTISVCYNDARKAKHVRNLHPINCAAFHPDQDLSLWSAMANVPDPEKPEGWTFQLMPSWPGLEDRDQNDAQRLTLLKQKTRNLAEPWKSAYEWIPEGTPVPSRNSTYWAAKSPWDNKRGRITPAGDAAHAMPSRKSC